MLDGGWCGSSFVFADWSILGQINDNCWHIAQRATLRIDFFGGRGRFADFRAVLSHGSLLWVFKLVFRQDAIVLGLRCLASTWVRHWQGWLQPSSQLPKWEVLFSFFQLPLTSCTICSFVLGGGSTYSPNFSVFIFQLCLGVLMAISIGAFMVLECGGGGKKESEVRIVWNLKSFLLNVWVCDVAILWRMVMAFNVEICK